MPIDELTGENLYQNPRERFLQYHENDPVREHPRSRRLGAFLLFAVGFVSGYLFYYIRIRGVL